MCQNIILYNLGLWELYLIKIRVDPELLVSSKGGNGL